MKIWFMKNEMYMNINALTFRPDLDALFPSPTCLLQTKKKRGPPGATLLHCIKPGTQARALPISFHSPGSSSAASPSFIASPIR